MEHNSHTSMTEKTMNLVHMSPRQTTGTTVDEYSGESVNLLPYSSGEKPSVVRRFVDSFKPYDYSQLPIQYFTSHSAVDYINSNPLEFQPEMHPNHPDFDYSKLSELERNAIVTSLLPLSKQLKSRHLQMIALGGSIGTGLFVGVGSSLLAAGPFGLLIVWLFIALVIFVTMSSLAELAVAFPISGAFITFNSLFIDSLWGFAMAWNYALQWLVTLPLELVAASMTIQYWNSHVLPAVFVAIFWVLICIINLFGVKGYGEAESVFSIIKIVAVVGFIILSIIIISGGAPPEHRYIGGSNWHGPDGGMFNSSEPFKNMCSTIFTAAFSFAGVELFGLASCETANPKASIPKAMKQVFWRVLIFYIGSIIMIGLLVPYKLSQLLGNNTKAAIAGVDINVSPFVIAIQSAKIPALPSIMNAVIIITVLSVGNSSVYGSSRTLAALGALRQGPKILNYIDRRGRPLVALAVQFAIGLLCFLVLLPGKNGTADAFSWMLSLLGLCSIFTWWSICLCHLRFRAALRARARVAEEELVYTTNIWGSWYGLITLAIILGLQFWAALFPPGNGGKADVKGFFQIYLGGPVVFVCYALHKIYAYFYKGVPLTKFYYDAKEIDVDTGRREIDLEIVKQEIAEMREQARNRPWIYRLYNVFC